MSGSGHLLETSVRVPFPRASVFPFFADAGNLQLLTPPFLRFRIDTPLPIDMRAGARIDYKLRLHGIPVRWRTLISSWEPPERFVDEQLLGPYRRWVHQHRFVEVDEGTRIEDRVEYESAGGRLLHDRFVRPNLERIFRYRMGVIRDRFGGLGATGRVEMR